MRMKRLTTKGKLSCDIITISQLVWKYRHYEERALSQPASDFSFQDKVKYAKTKSSGANFFGLVSRALHCLSDLNTSFALNLHIIRLYNWAISEKLSTQGQPNAIHRRWLVAQLQVDFDKYFNFLWSWTLRYVQLIDFDSRDHYWLQQQIYLLKFKINLATQSRARQWQQIRHNHREK